MMYAEKLVAIYRSRAASQNWAAWANEHMQAAAVLADAERIANGE